MSDRKKNNHYVIDHREFVQPFVAIVAFERSEDSHPYSYPN
jgi:hypothetical protein